MNPLAQQLSVQQKVEIRRDLRNLDNFLTFSFDKNKRLALVDEKVHGYIVKSFIVMDFKDIDWKNYPFLWWNNSLSLKKICLYVEQNASRWGQLLREDSQKLIAFEKQCALLEKLAIKYNLKKAIDNNSEEPITFLNPFKKMIRLEVSYPEISGFNKRVTRIQNVYYDRTNSASDLEKKVREELDRPVSMKISASLSLQSKEKIDCIFSVIPKNLFKKVVQHPLEFLDPSKEIADEENEIVTVSYDDPDPSVLSGILYHAGKQQASSSYEQGFIAGKNYGYGEAMKQIHTTLSGK